MTDNWNPDFLNLQPEEGEMLQHPEGRTRDLRNPIRAFKILKDFDEYRRFDPKVESLPPQLVLLIYLLGHPPQLLTAAAGLQRRDLLMLGGLPPDVARDRTLNVLRKLSVVTLFVLLLRFGPEGLVEVLRCRERRIFLQHRAGMIDLETAMVLWDRSSFWLCKRPLRGGGLWRGAYDDVADYLGRCRDLGLKPCPVRSKDKLWELQEEMGEFDVPEDPHRRLSPVQGGSLPGAGVQVRLEPVEVSGQLLRLGVEFSNCLRTNPGYRTRAEAAEIALLVAYFSVNSRDERALVVIRRLDDGWELEEAKLSHNREVPGWLSQRLDSWTRTLPVGPTPDPLESVWEAVEEIGFVAETASPTCVFLTDPNSRRASTSVRKTAVVFYRGRRGELGCVEAAQLRTLVAQTRTLGGPAVIEAVIIILAPGLWLSEDAHQLVRGRRRPALVVLEKDWEGEDWTESDLVEPRHRLVARLVAGAIGDRP